MKHLYTTTLLLLFATAAFAQTFKPVDHWRAGSTGSDGIWDIAIDSAGNQYICGYFTGTVDIDPGPGVYNLTQPSGQTQEDAFLLKLDASGNFVWAKHFGGTVDAPRVARGLAVDSEGDVYVFGWFNSNIRAQSTSTLWSTNTASSTDSPFLFKFSSSGLLLWDYGWFNSAGGSIDDIDFNNANDVYIAGTFRGTYDFNPLLGTNNIISRSSNGMRDIYFMQLSQAGAIKRIVNGGSTGNDLVASIKSDGGGNLFVSGSFSNSMDFNFGGGTAVIQGNGPLDGYILKLDTTLNYQWVKTFSSNGGVFCRSMTIHNQKIYNYGAFYSNIDLNPDSSITNNYNSNGGKDCFIQILDLTGLYLNGATFGGTGNEDGGEISHSKLNSIDIVGYFENVVDFDPSLNTNYLVSSNGGFDGFVLRVDTTLSFMNVASFGSSAIGILERINSVKHTGVIGSSAVGGHFRNTIDINPSSLITQNVTSAGQDDMLYLRLESCTNDFIQNPITACGSQFILPSGKVVYASGFYPDTVLSSQGCDSVNAINLTLLALPNTTVTQTGTTFTAQPGLTYQWFNCQTNQPIAGETAQTFTATANGQYAVIVSNTNCTDTSVCYSITNIGLHEAHLPAVSMYPNPTNGLLRIECAQSWQKTEVIDLMGRTIFSQKQPQEELDLSLLASGIYLVKVYFREGVVVQRVVRQ